MADVLSIIVFVVSGTISGIVAGMGMGGGTLLIPLLVLLTDTSQLATQGINMAAFLPGAIIAIVMHKKAGRIYFSECVPIIIAGIAFAVLGAFLATLIKGGLLRRLFAIFLFILAIIQIISTEKKSRQGK